MKSNKARNITFCIALVINLLVLANNFLHNPEVGYDAQEHLDYISTLHNHLPTVNDTAEYYSPPLPYFLPSLVDKVCLQSNPTGNCQFIDGKFAQFINLLLSIGITLILLKLAELLKPGNEFFKISLLSFLGILTVYYKTFAQVRGEPYVAFFVVLITYQIARLVKSSSLSWWKETIALGLSMGALDLSRQWGIFLLPAILALALLIFIKNRSKGLEIGRIILPAFVIAFFASGWFYLHNYLAYGSLTPFNISHQGFSFSNEPPSFYSKGFNNPDLYTSPVRGTFNNEFVPTFYSETWGDYWGYWVFIREPTLSLPYMTNRPKINTTLGPINFAELVPMLHADGDQVTAFLGRVNLISLFPTLLLVGGVLAGIYYAFRYLLTSEKDQNQALYSFVLFGLLFSMAGYMWFLISYPSSRGATIKATYMIQVFMLLPILGAEMLDVFRRLNKYVYVVISLLLLVVFLLNFPVFITRYWWFIPGS